MPRCSKCRLPAIARNRYRMPQNTHLELEAAEAGRQPQSPRLVDVAGLRSSGRDLARRLVWLPNLRSSRLLVERCAEVTTALKPVMRALQSPTPQASVSDDF